QPRPRRPTPLPYTTLFRSRQGMERSPTRLRQTLPDVLANRVVHDEAAGNGRREEVLCLQPVDRGLPLVGETMEGVGRDEAAEQRDRKSTRLNSSHEWISYA